MENAHENHLDQIKQNFLDNVDYKYRRGQEEHKGKLWELGTRKIGFEIRNEAIDQVVYADVLNEDLHKIACLVEVGLRESTPDYALKNILQEIKQILK